MLAKHGLKKVWLGYLILLASCPGPIKEYSIKSPSQEIEVRFYLSAQGETFYRVMFKNKMLIRNSRLGLALKDSDFREGLSSASAPGEQEIITEQYELFHGKRLFCTYRAIRHSFSLIAKTGQHLDLVFQVSDDGIVFRYILPGPGGSKFSVVAENTFFAFPPQTKAFIQPMQMARTGYRQTNPAYEEDYTKGLELNKLPTNLAGWAFPALFQTPVGWVVLTETASDNYCGCRLRQLGKSEAFLSAFQKKARSSPANPTGQKENCRL